MVGEFYERSEVPGWPHPVEPKHPETAPYLRWNPYEQDPYHPDPYAPR
ncbi:MAG TPA: hypothetical protein VN436_09035 [Holophaga sp.]|nr:hypothetical protein [Holophaga sp.]